MSKPKGLGTDFERWLGKMLRIDVDAKDPGKEYAVPPDNPFARRTSPLPEIWAKGLRNPAPDMAIMSGIEDRFRIALNCERFSPLFRLERTHLYQLRADRIIFEPNHTVRENIPGRQGEDMV